MSKTNKEQHAHLVYNKLLKEVIYPLTGDKTTYLSELNGAGKKMLGVKFKGVFPADRIPQLNDLSKYAICNLDTSKESGSHWVAIAKEGKDTYLYDSFGRKGVEVFPELQFSGNGRIIDTDRDAEQTVMETDCGARCVAWLCFLDRWGIETARLI